MELSMDYIEELTGKQLRQLSMEDEGIYGEEGIQELEDSDAISAEEGAFMMGYLSATY